MIDGVEGLFEAEIDQIDRVSFVHYTGYTLLLMEKAGQAWSMRTEVMLIR